MAHIKAKTHYQEDLHFILGNLRGYYPKFSSKAEERIAKAFVVAEEAHEGQFRSSGEPYFTHPIAATRILLEIKPDTDTICACLLHDVIEDTPITADEVEEIFGPRIRFLCEGVEKVAKIRISKDDTNLKKFENTQKLFVALSKDIRVIFVKLADRIHNLRTLHYVRPEKQERIARESLEVYAPIAEKFGLFQFKSEIETLCFAILHPSSFAKLTKQIRASETLREKLIQQAKREILRKFREEDFDTIEIQGRRKDLYSIYKKMKRKKIQSVDEIYDYLGVRILVKNNEDCYRALGILHSQWRPLPGRFKDYIALPKPNGYQSLHTTLLGLGQNTLPTEFQIRTQQMHMDAEYGPAAHWAYKRFGTSDFDDEYIKKTSWLPKYIDEGKNASADAFFKDIAKSIFSERIYVFTPKGDIKFYSKGATPIDFAYSVHTDIGHTCIGAKINGVIKPLNYKLKNGDVVSIITRKGRQPNPLWLNFVRSTGTKDKIKQFLRKENIQFAEKPQQQKKVQLDEKGEVIKEISTKTPKTTEKHGSTQLIIGGEKDLSYRLMPCCKPKVGDSLLAYKGRGLTFSIHRDDCSELDNLEPERFIEAYFRKSKTLKILVSDDTGVFFKVSSVVVNHGVRLHSIKTKHTKDNDEVLLTLGLYVRSETEFNQLKQDLSRTEYFIEFR